MCLLIPVVREYLTLVTYCNDMRKGTEMGLSKRLPESLTIIGLDVGGTKTAVVEGASTAEILQREEIATEASRSFDETFPRIAVLIKKTIEVARQSSRQSGEGLVELASRMFPGRWSRETPIREVVEAMLADDPQALEVAAEAGKWMGRGMALLVDTLNPQIIALGSLAVALGDRVLAPARRALAQEALPQAVAACEVVPAKLGRKIGDVAALMAALTDGSVRAKLGL
jgi:predicted NBD/HSP70 family sugar kinase